MNWLQEYVEYASEVTDAPRIFHEYVGLAIVASVIGNKFYLPFGDTAIYPNLWLILIAPSSAYRKTTSMNIGKRLLMDQKKDWIYPNDFTTESFIKVMASRPSGILFYDEFRSLVSQMNKEYNAGLQPFLTSIYDCPGKYRRTKAKEEIEILKPCLSIISGTTIDWFLRGVKQHDYEGGFLPRFLIIPAKKKEKPLAFPPKADVDKRDKLDRELQRLAKFEGVAFFDNVKKQHEEWFQKFNARYCNVDGFMAGFFQRLQIYVFKFAMILQVMKNKDKNIEPDVFDDAAHRINWIAKQLLDLESEEITFDRYQENAKKVMKFIRRNEGQATRSQVSIGTRITKKFLDTTIDDLVEQGRIEIITPKGVKPGRNTTIYKIIKNGNGN